MVYYSTIQTKSNFFCLKQSKFFINIFLIPLPYRLLPMEDLSLYVQNGRMLL